MNAYQYFVAHLNLKIDAVKEQKTNKEKQLYLANVNAKNALIMLGEEIFNIHMKNILEGSYDYLPENEKDNAEYYYNIVGNLFHKGFRQYDVSDRFYPQKYKSYQKVQFRVEPEVIEDNYNIDGWIDLNVWLALSCDSDFWDVIHDYTVQNFKGVSK